MRLYCDEVENNTTYNSIDEWFRAGEDIDDFIFYKETEKISEK